MWEAGEEQPYKYQPWKVPCLGGNEIAFYRLFYEKLHLKHAPTKLPQSFFKNKSTVTTMDSINGADITFPFSRLVLRNLTLKAGATFSSAGGHLQVKQLTQLSVTLGESQVST